MLYFDRIDISEGIDVNKSSQSKEWDICHYRYFLDKGFKFQLNVCNGCHDLLMSMNLSDTASLNKVPIIAVSLAELGKVSHKLNEKYHFDQNSRTL